ncbi:hypothetical protein AO498_08287 [Algoriphagus sanaruensis]|uniref:Uncharacterized protein n=1 Tax=Algoriphagus sanaruensis TaxID=1727163 RepID=A0A142EMQ6_9BACT|nr:hypothetical protein AO498_08287 [Algoriphagus sanaruensis]
MHHRSAEDFLFTAEAQRTQRVRSDHSNSPDLLPYLLTPNSRTSQLPYPHTSQLPYLPTPILPTYNGHWTFLPAPVSGLPTSFIHIFSKNYTIGICQLRISFYFQDVSRNDPQSTLLTTYFSLHMTDLKHFLNFRPCPLGNKTNLKIESKELR